MQSAALCGILKEKDFKVFDHPFKLLYDVNRVQRMVTTDFPQRYGDVAILPKTDGGHRNKFQPSFLTGDGDDVKRFAAFNLVVTCQDRPKRPNQNASICRAEKSV